MYTDITMSGEIDMKFKRYVKDKNSTELYMNVLTSSMWPFTNTSILDGFILPLQVFYYLFNYFDLF